MTDNLKKSLLINAVASLIQVAIVGAVLFFQYRFLLHVIGAEGIGIWSLVIAATAATQIANLGLSASVIKYVAKYIARGEPATVSRLIQTAVLTAGGAIALVLIAAYPLLKIILKAVVPGPSLAAAVGLLPYTVIAFWLLIVTSVYQAGLDGIQRVYLRSGLLVGSAVLHLFLCLALAPRFGLIGLGYARLVQNALTLVFSLVLLKKFLPGIQLFPRVWDRPLFKEMLGYGVKFQAISLFAMFYDPMTKALISRFGSLAMVGFFEMSNRMIMQVRALLVSANQAIVPAIAHLAEKIPDRVQEVYRTSYRLMYYLAWPLFAGIALSAPFISRIWIGRVEPAFVGASLLLAVGNLASTLAVPAYFSFMGLGDLRWNLISHVVMAVLNLGLGMLLGAMWDGLGAIWGWAISLVIGGLLIILPYYRRHGMRLREACPGESLWLVVCSLAGLAMGLMFWIHGGFTLAAQAKMLIALTGLLMAAMWFHPMRKKMFSWVRIDILGIRP